MKIFIGFLRGLWILSPFWRGWVGLLIVVNGVVPLFFLARQESRVVLAVFVIGAMLQMIIFRAKGFVRLLGIGHVLWIPMLVWLWPRSVAAGLDSSFGVWLAAVLVADLVSLLIDAADVVRYALGERQPSLTMEDV